MGKEIERKFLLKSDALRLVTANTHGTRVRQGYLCVGPPVAVRVRIAGDKAQIKIKKSTLSLTRDEFEYSIPLEDAEAILAGLCEGHVIEKTRYKIPYGGPVWEIDVFGGMNEGLVVAEVELESEGQSFDRPEWLGDEVSGDARYLNTHLSRMPYALWPVAAVSDDDLGF